jgi:hypothetical protein
MSKKQINAGLLAAALAIGFLLTGCEGSVGGAGPQGIQGPKGDPSTVPGPDGLAVNGPVASTLAGAAKYFAEGNKVVYLLGADEIGSGGSVTAFALGLGETLVVSTYADLNGRAVTENSVGSIAVTDGALTIAGGQVNAVAQISFKAGSKFTAGTGARISTPNAFNFISFETGEEIADAADSEAGATFAALKNESVFIAVSGGAPAKPAGVVADLTAANAFRTAHKAALALTAETVKGDDVSVAAATLAYNAITSAVAKTVYLAGVLDRLDALTVEIAAANALAAKLDAAKTAIAAASTGAAVKTAVNAAVPTADALTASDGNALLNKAFLAATLGGLEALASGKTPQEAGAVKAIEEALAAAAHLANLLDALATGLPLTVPTTEAALTTDIVSAYFTDLARAELAKEPGSAPERFTATAEAGTVDATKYTILLEYGFGGTLKAQAKTEELALTIIVPSIAALTVPAIGAPALGVPLGVDLPEVATPANAVSSDDIVWGENGAAYDVVGLPDFATAYFAKVVLSAVGGYTFAEGAGLVITHQTVGVDASYALNGFAAGIKVTRDVANKTITLEYKFDATPAHIFDLAIAVNSAGVVSGDVADEGEAVGYYLVSEDKQSILDSWSVATLAENVQTALDGTPVTKAALAGTLANNDKFLVAVTSRDGAVVAAGQSGVIKVVMSGLYARTPDQAFNAATVGVGGLNAVTIELSGGATFKAGALYLRGTGATSAGGGTLTIYGATGSSLKGQATIATNGENVAVFAISAGFKTTNLTQVAVDASALFSYGYLSGTYVIPGGIAKGLASAIDLGTGGGITLTLPAREANGSLTISATEAGVVSFTRVGSGAISDIAWEVNGISAGAGNTFDLSLYGPGEWPVTVTAKVGDALQSGSATITVVAAPPGE